MDSFEVAVIGAGFAGAASAWFLARRGITDVLVLDQETLPGVHSSGRNAAMVRQVVPDPAIAALAREGAAFIRSQPVEWQSHAPYRQNGSLLLAENDMFRALERDAQIARDGGIEVRMLDREQCLSIAPWIEGGSFTGGAYCPTDGIVDIAALLDLFLNEARSLGVTVHLGERLTGIDTRDGSVAGIRTTEGAYAVKTIINASGAWAAEVAAMAGAQQIPLIPYRRHLFVTESIPGIDTNWPFVWDISHEAYFRPEPPGLLLCACDEQAASPGVPAEDPDVMEFLAEKLIKCFPRLAETSVVRHWAGLRTMAPDHRFVVGCDARVQGFFWLAGMGGHGVTTSGAIGRLTADLVASGRDSGNGPFDPSRFIKV